MRASSASNSGTVREPGTDDNVGNSMTAVIEDYESMLSSRCLPDAPANAPVRPGTAFAQSRNACVDIGQHPVEHAYLHFLREMLSCRR